MWDEEFNPGLWPRVRKWAKNAITDQLGNIQGKPGKLIRLIDEGVIQSFTPIEYEKSIWSPSVAKWELWSRNLDYQPLPIEYWEFSTEEHRHYKKSIHIGALGNLIKCEIIENGTLDIKEIKGIAASKSDSYFFSSIEKFATVRCQKFIGSGQSESLHKNMKWREIWQHNLKFMDKSWSDHSPFWMNSGGSHHFAAAHYIATINDLSYQLEGKIKRFSVNKHSAEKLVSEWDMFLIDNTSLYTGFLEAMRSFKCDFCVSDIPRRLFKNETDKSNKQNRVRIVFLKKDNFKSNQVAKYLKKSGFVSFNIYVNRLVS